MTAMVWTPKPIEIPGHEPWQTARCVSESDGADAFQETADALTFRCRSHCHGRRMSSTSHRRYGTHKTPWRVRFWRYVPVNPGVKACWEWQGTRAEGGYGTIAGDGGGAKRIRAHRASYTIHYGEIPDGLMVCHRCDNPPCVNPAHLFAASQGDNLRDMVQKGREGAGVFKPGERVQYSDEAIRTMRQLAAEGVEYADICTRFGIERHYLCDLVRGRKRAAAGGPIRTGTVRRVANKDGHRVHVAEGGAA